MNVKKCAITNQDIINCIKDGKTVWTNQASGRKSIAITPRQAYAVLSGKVFALCEKRVIFIENILRSTGHKKYGT